ncbi:Hypothetical Protein sle_02540 [Streptomyces leeuwenhoekii]|uniref:Uncharacterized protein n=1 Tax=Streptomyces leeuwenhoekii TaxID=1437453 RepID=A0A0F7VS42_STRLW|nr:Hypothetical Protein sle_02540 [Streptomyces leeuwenhoekii]
MAAFSSAWISLLGESGVVVDGGVDVVEAHATAGAAAGLAAQDLVAATVGDSAELLDVDVDEFPGTVALVAADDRGDTNGMADAFVRDLRTGAVQRGGVADDGTRSNGRTGLLTIDASGRTVSFDSGADNLVPGDANGRTDVFTRRLR